MKNSLQKYLKATAVAAGFALGAFALSALASDWTAPLNTPPSCSEDEIGCYAPINVSSVAQYKNGPLGINETTMTKDTSGNLIGAFEVNGKASFLSSIGVAGDAIVVGLTRTVGGLVIQTCTSGSCPGDGSHPVETGQIWLIQ